MRILRDSHKVDELLIELVTNLELIIQQKFGRKKCSILASSQETLIDHQGNQVKRKKCLKKIIKKKLEGGAPTVCGGLSSSAVSSSTLYAYTCHFRGILLVHWTCRVFSGPWGLVVVRASWPRYPTLIRKKKSEKKVGK